jgi:hypothetical protein
LVYWESVITTETRRTQRKSDGDVMAGKGGRIMYIELKSGYSGNGPASISRVTFSKTGRTVYFQSKQLQSSGGQGVQGNYFDVETREEYWVSGPKRNGTDRHSAGGGTAQIDEDVADEYWREIRKCDQPKNPLVV